jgi:hypothetical protein
MEEIDLVEAPAASPPGNNLVNRRQGGPHNMLGRFGEEKIYCSFRDLNPESSKPI